MAATPQPDDVAARLADLQRQIDELGRKTFSNLSVTDSVTQNSVLKINQDSSNNNASRVTIRDSSNDIIFQNDTVAGWGYTAPNIAYSVVPFNMLSATSGWMGTDI